MLQEFYVQATRPTRPGALHHDEAVLAEAFRLRERFRLSYWDCAILAAARTCGCNTVLSEDMSNRQDYEGIRVVNPFRTEISRRR